MAEAEIESLSVLVPCLNEQDNIGRFQKEIIDYFRTFSFPTEFIFIDDGSSDETAKRLEQLKKSNPDIIILHHQAPQGLGAALQIGFSAASHRWILTLDADLTFHPIEFPKLIKAFSHSNSAVSGSAVKGGFQGVSLIRRLLSVIVNKMYSRLLGREFLSASSIFRLYKSDVIRSLSLESRNFDINAEIIAKLILSGHQVVEAPVFLTSRIYGQSKINTFREIRNHLVLMGKIATWKARIKNV